MNPEDRKGAAIHLRLTMDERLYLKAISMTKKVSEPDLLREMIGDFITPYRGDSQVERARRDAIRYGLVKD